MALLEETAELDLSEIADEELFQRSLKMPSLFSIILDRYQDAFLRKAKNTTITLLIPAPPLAGHYLCFYPNLSSRANCLK